MKSYFVLIVVAIQLAITDALRLPNLSLRKVAASGFCILSLGGALGAPQEALAFGAPSGLEDLRVKDSNYGKLADVGVGQYLVKDGRQHLRLATPVGSKMQFSGTLSPDSPVKRVTDSLELIRLRLEQVGYTNKNAWSGAATDVSNVVSILATKGSDQQLVGIGKKALFDDFRSQFNALESAVKEKDAIETLKLQEQAASTFNQLQMSGLPMKKLPYSLPDDYATLPKLFGRATVDFTLEKSGRGFQLNPTDPTYSKEQTFRIVLDGYTHPITAGNFLDLVDKKVYDGVSLRGEELTVYTQKPEGYIPSGAAESRKIPLEIFYKKDAEPTYGITSDDDSRATDTQKLPFQAFGALGMARGNDDVDTASAGKSNLKIFNTVGSLFHVEWCIRQL